MHLLTMELEEDIQNTERFYENLERNIDGDNLVTKDDFCSVLSSCLTEAKSFSETKAFLEKTLKCKLGLLDCNFVEAKYVELLIEHWLEDTYDKIIKCFNPKQPAEFISLLNHLCTFHDCYDNLDHLIYNNLITDLLESESNLSNNLKYQEKILFSKLKQRCISNILVFFNESHGEIGFIRHLIYSLKHTKDFEQFFHTLQIRSFLNDQVTFKELLLKFNQSYFSCEKHLRQLQSLAFKIFHHDHHHTEELKKIIADYLEPVTFKESHTDGRYMLEVVGKHLVFSKVLSDLEQHPHFLDIEEVRFVNFGAVHIDANLTHTLWHGKNLVILADVVIVSEDKNVIWDVSGINGNPLENNSSPGTDPHGLGLDGEKGNPGESGGNICILYSSLENGHNLRIISNGGNGSQGNNGGNGRNGEDGMNVDGNTFKKEFPPASKFQDSKKLMNIEKTMQRIASDLESVDLFTYKHSDISISKEEFKDFFSKHSLGTTFFEVTTKKGLKITFSFFLGNIFTVCQSYLLIKGSPGKCGEPGGSGGSGGKGGFSGHIQIAQKVSILPEIFAENGENGATGTPGLYGIPGKYGLDRGYMDYSASLLSRSKWPKWFIPNPEDNNRLAMIPHTDRDSDYVWCEKKQSYIEIAAAPRHVRVVESSRPQAPHTETKSEDQVARKKTINAKAILELYKVNQSVFEEFNVGDELEVRDELEALLKKYSHQTELVTKELHVIRQLSICFNDWYCNEMITVKKPIISLKETKSKVQDVPLSQLIGLVNNNPNNLTSWTHFRNVRLNFQELSKLWDIATSNKSFTESNGEIFAPLTWLCDKYRLFTLNTIANNLQVCGFPDTTLRCEKIDQIEFLQIKESCISDTRPNSNNVDFVENYICNDNVDLREEVMKIINLTRIEENAMKSSISIFLDEVDCQESDTLSKLKNLSSDSKRRKKLNYDFLVFKSEVLKPQNHDIKQLFEDAAKQNVTATIDFDLKVSNDKWLSIMYSRLIKGLKSESDWGGFIGRSEKKFKDLFTDFILSKGPSSKTYREFLSHHFGINIQIYSNQKLGNTLLISNHNPSASISVQFLEENDRFVRLNFDVDLANLITNISKYGEFYKKVMFHLDSLEERSQFENFISSKPFRSNSYDGVNRNEEIRLKIRHVVDQDKNCRQIANSFLCRNDKLVIHSRIEKLKLGFIDNESLLHYMALQFNTEGSQLSSAELCFIINIILRFSMEQPRIMPMISWIIAAYSQEHWLTEFALIELEFYLKRELQTDVKIRWRKYLGAENNRESLIVLIKHIKSDNCSLTQDNFEEVFYLMSNVPSALDGLENYVMSEWKYFLKDRYWESQLKSLSSWDDEELKELSFYLVTLENLNGMELCKTILSYLKERSKEMKSESNKLEVKISLKMLSTNKISCSDTFLKKIREQKVKYWQRIIDTEYLNTVEERNIDQLAKLLQRSGNTSDKILNILPVITQLFRFNSTASYEFKSINETEMKDLFDSMKSKPLMEKLKSLGKKIFDNVSKFNYGSLLGFLEACEIPLSNSQPKNADIGNCTSDQPMKQFILVPLICSAIETKHKIVLRDTQKLSIMTFLRHPGNTLAQISTGEGKSLIIVAIAIYKALNNKKVNVITSSKVLAERDAKLYKDIFEFCGVTVGHNCSGNIEERKKVYSNCQVIYGDLANFQRDYLLDRFYDQNILGDCNFEAVIVDEVDSMLLDKGANILYLCHPIPGLDSLELLFVQIWKLISSSIETHNFKKVFNVLTIKEHFMFQIFGQIKKEDIAKLDSNISKKCLIDTWDFLVDKHIINNRGIVDKRNVQDLNLDDVPSECVAKEHLKYFLKKVIEREIPFQIPNCYRQFVEDHLESWIKSAMIAMKMENGRDYVVDVDRTHASSDRCPNITILDRDTGTDLESSQWDEGLHQFLQLKHGCKLSLISLKNVFISNVSFLKRYQQLHGLSGTLGSKRERELLKEIYNVELVTIPTAKTKLLEEIPPVICFNQDEWAKNIIEKTNEIAKKRSVLIICESVNEVLTLKDKFPNRKVHIYKRDYEALTAAEKLEPGHIIISTNLAGRGTDIKLSNQLVKAGGLHVCLSFLPSNCRVEEQAYGRAARNGDPGTAQMIFKCTTTNQLSSLSQSKVIDLKRERDMNELIRLVNVRTNYESKIKAEEKWFGKFEEKYKLLSNKKVTDEIVKKILLQICLEKWTFWLDKNSKDILENEQGVGQSFNNLIASCESLFEYNNKHWLENISDPVHFTKLGLAFLTKEPKTAILLFDRVIDQEPNFSESAYYYRVCAKTKAEDLDSNASILVDLTQVFNQLQKKVNELAYSVNIIDRIKDHDSNNILQIDSFKRQQTDKCNIYNMFMQSILNISGHEINPETLVHPSFLDTFGAANVYYKLIEGNILTDIHLNPQLSEKNLYFVVKYGLLPLKVKSFLENYKFSKQFDIHDFLKILKQEFKVPSRELFWKELIANRLLKEEVKFAFVDMCLVESIDPSLKNHLELAIGDVAQMNSGKVWLYEQEELFQLNPNLNLSILKKEEFKSRIGVERYNYLKKRNVFFVNKRATFKLVEDLTFKYFDSLQLADFQLLDITENVASSIINDLVQKKLIRENMSKVYTLACDPSLLEDVELSSNKAYSFDVRSLLLLCFAHRISLSKALLLQATNGGQFCLNFLPTTVHKNMFFDMISEKVLKLPMICGNENLDSAMRRLYRKEMSKTELIKLFTDIFGTGEAREIVDGLIRSNWLLPSNPSPQTNPKTYYVNENFEKKINNSSPLDGNLHSNKETISSILRNHLKCVNYLLRPEYITFLQYLKGDHLTVKTPGVSLKPLTEVLKERQMPMNEVEMFSMKGFDHFVVLEEKRWTWKTKLGIFILISLAIIEVVIGAALLLGLNPQGGVAFLSEGSNDMIQAINCIFTGHFSWKNYALNKLISLSLAACNFIFLNPKCASILGGKIQSTSLKRLKEGFTNLFSNDSVKLVVKQSSKTIMSAITRGVIYSTADYVIERHLENLSETIVQTVYSDMDEIIDDFHCPSIGDVFRMFETSEAQCIVSDSLTQVLEYLLTNYEKDCLDLMSMITKIIKQLQIDSWQFERTPSSVIDLLFRSNEIIKLANSILKKSIEYKNLLNKLISIIMQNVHDKLADIVDQKQCKDFHKLQTQTDSSNQMRFVEETKNNWKNMIQNELSSRLKQSIMSPLLQYTANRFANISHRFIAQKSKGLWNGKKNREINKFKEKHLMKIRGEDCKLDRFHESEFDETLIQMLIRQRRAKLFLEVMKRNLPVDTSFIEVCCTVVPSVLKKEGINCPSLEIIVECSDYQERFYTNKEKKPISTIVIAPDTGLKNNLSLNKVLLKSLVDNMISNIIKYDSQNQNLTFEILSNVLMKAIEKYFDLSEFIETNNVGSPTTHSANVLNMSIENEAPCQHSLPDANWIFRPQIDYDLRRNESTVSKVHVQEQIYEGFLVALEKINDHINTCHQAFSNFKLKIEDFKEKEFDIFLQTDKRKKGNFCCVTTKYDLTVPISILVENNSVLSLHFKIIMELKHRSEKISGRTPIGPHIVYKISPENRLSYCTYNGIEGHILLNKECEEIIYLAENCHVAGELILYSGFSMQKSCKVLFVGETLLAGAFEITSIKDCVVKSFKNISELKTGISEIPIYYKDVLNVIIYAGMSDTLTVKGPIKILMEIDSVLSEVQKHVKKVKITVFSLYKVEEKKGKIIQVNKTLRHHCGCDSHNILDLNQVITSSDMETDGRHIKTSVMKKIIEEALKSAL